MEEAMRTFIAVLALVSSSSALAGPPQASFDTGKIEELTGFAGADDKAVVDGDFTMLESELQGVLKALRGAGIDIVAIHQHMTGESPRVMFLHSWGVGPTEGLAKGLRAALDRTAAAPKTSR